MKRSFFYSAIPALCGFLTVSAGLNAAGGETVPVASFLDKPAQEVTAGFVAP